MTGVALWKMLVDLEENHSLSDVDRAELQGAFDALHRHEVVLMSEDAIAKIQRLHEDLVVPNQV